MEETNDRPWEEPGAARRDCAPHRGPLLKFFGLVSHTMAWVGLCWPLGLGFTLLGLALGLTVWLLARRDLARIRAGLVDPSGKLLTWQAREEGIRACAVGCTIVMGYAFIFWFLYYLAPR